MLVHAIRLTNFKAFYGEHVISFPAPSKGRNVYLLGGENGAGKTTVVQALLLALYGVGAASFPGMFSAGRDYRRKYEAWLAAARNAQAQDEGTDLVIVGGAFEAGARRIEVRRSFWYSAGGKLEEELLEVREDFRDTSELFAGETAQDRVALWMPRHLAELIFFDGEQVRSQLGEDAGAVAGALDRLLDLEPIAKLLEDITRLSRDRRAALLSDGQLDAMLRLEAQVDELQTRHRAAAQVCQELAQQKEVLASEAHRVQEALDERLSGNAPLTSRQLAQELDSLRHRRDDLRGRLGRHLGDWLYLALASSHVTSAAGALSTERDSRKGRERHKVGEEAASAFAEALIAKAEGVLDADAVTSMRDLIRDLQSETGAGADLAGETVEANLSRMGDDELAWAEDTAINVLTRDRDDVAYLSQDLLTVQERISQLEIDKSRLGSHGLVDQLVVRLRQLDSERSDVSAKLDNATAERRDVEDRLAQTAGALTRLTQRAGDSDDAAAWLDAAERLSLALASYVEARRHLAIKRVEAALLSRLKDLLHKRQLVKSVEIDAESYRITLSGTRGRPIDLPSAGEHQLVAMAFAAAMLECSASPLPMFVDTPLARLDGSHRGNVVERFWPRVGRQVFVLSTDREVAGPLLDSLNQHVAQTYVIEHDDATGRSRVIEGSYFGAAGHA